MYAPDSKFKIALKLGLSIGIIPLLMLSAWVYGSITSFRKRSSSVFIVLLCIVLACIFNVYRIRSYEMQVSPLGSPIPFPVEELYFEYAVIISTVLGSILTYLIFRKRNLREETKAAIEAIGTLE